MPWKVRKPTASETAPDWLRPYCNQFLQKLADQGYAPATIRIYDASARLLCQEVAQRRLREGELLGRPLEKVRVATLKAMHPNKYKQRRYCLERFIDALVEAGVAERPKRPERAPTALERLAAEYEGYLREQRGLTEATIYHCVRFLHRFMRFRFGERLGDVNDITPDDIVRFLREVMGRKSPFRDKTPPTHLRNLFRSFSGAGRRSGIWRAACRAWRHHAHRICRDHCSPRRSSACSTPCGHRTLSAGATTQC